MKNSIKYLLLFLCLPLLTWARKPLTEKPIVQPQVIVKKDTVYLVKKIPDDTTVKLYQEILEKTNSQLSLWWNPYGVLITVLGVLFGILTIIAAVVIYRQSKEYKELINDSLTKHETVLSQLITERNQQLKNIETSLNNTITDYKEKLKTATEENKKEINKMIKTLEEQKESIDTQIQSNVVVPQPMDNWNTFYIGSKNKLHKCSQCGHGYIVQDDPYGMNTNRLRLAVTDKETITCPKCGNIEFYNPSYF
ncbi:MAG: hypothetical protein ACXVNM_12295 [Bacteroidia bacterium]